MISLFSSIQHPLKSAYKHCTHATLLQNKLTSHSQCFLANNFPTVLNMSIHLVRSTKLINVILHSAYDF